MLAKWQAPAYNGNEAAIIAMSGTERAAAAMAIELGQGTVIAGLFHGHPHKISHASTDNLAGKAEVAPHCWGRRV